MRLIRGISSSFLRSAQSLTFLIWPYFPKGGSPLDFKVQYLRYNGIVGVSHVFQNILTNHRPPFTPETVAEPP